MENTKNKKEKKQILTPEQMSKCLTELYSKVLVGLPKVSDPVQDIAKEYLSKNNNDIKKAASSMIKYQLAKCGATGFLTSFGGFITMPITIPADLSSILYVQMRMVAAIAAMAGYDIESDQTRTAVYATLAGVSVASIAKKFGIEFTKKVSKNLITKVPGKVLTKINKMFGFRLITKFGTKGLLNLGKAIPVLGGLVGAGFDIAETKIVANRAYKLFIENEDFNDKDTVNVDDIKYNPDADETEVVEETILKEEPID